MIYLADFEKLQIKEDYARMLVLFPAETQERITRFRQEEGRLRALTREVLLRGMLYETFGGQELVLEKNSYGKPFVKSVDFHFNISHSGTVVVLGTGDVPLGVDVERMDHVKDFRKLLRFFSEAEREHILTAAVPEDEFYRVWTFREAFSKMEGTGLSLFEKEDVAIDFEKCHVTFHGETLHFFEYSYPGYKMAVCSDMSETPSPTIINHDRWEMFCRAAMLANISEQ